MVPPTSPQLGPVAGTYPEAIYFSFPIDHGPSTLAEIDPKTWSAVTDKLFLTGHHKILLGLEQEEIGLETQRLDPFN